MRKQELFAGWNLHYIQTWIRFKLYSDKKSEHKRDFDLENPFNPMYITEISRLSLCGSVFYSSLHCSLCAPAFRQPNIYWVCNMCQILAQEIKLCKNAICMYSCSATKHSTVKWEPLWLFSHTSIDLSVAFPHCRKSYLSFSLYSTTQLWWANSQLFSSV